MAAHPYGLRSRLNGQLPSVRTTPTGSPLAKTESRSPKKSHQSGHSLQLLRVIGTTANSPNGLACAPATNTYAYCAGAVVVLAKVQQDGTVSHRYFKARPMTLSLNPPTAYYETQSPISTPTRRRTTIFSSRRGQDEYLSNAVGRDWSEDSGGQTWTARERIKSATCTALSRDGRWLAIGESGYNPRVLLFSTSEDAALEIPTSIVSDHTFGVRSVAFSPDSYYLATLGNLNDGFLFIWTINSKTGSLKLHSTNKCTSNVCDMSWCGNNLVTVGTRHVKIWQTHQSSEKSPTKKSRLKSDRDQTASPGPTTLQGRNCLLGHLADATFTSITSISDGSAIVGTDSGHICLLQTSATSIELKILKQVDYPITSVSFRASTRRLVFGGRWGLFNEDLDTLQRRLAKSVDQSPRTPRQTPRVPRISSIRRSLGVAQQQKTGVVAVGCLMGHTIMLDDDGNLQLLRDEGNEERSIEPTFASHNDVIQGVQILPAKAGVGAFLTWSKNGEVRFWNLDGCLLARKLVPLDSALFMDDENANELKLVRFLSVSGHLVIADRFGVIKIIGKEHLEVTFTCRAHSTEINDITLDEGNELVATCGRDRMVQVFRIAGTELQLVQTLDDHVGAVSHIAFASGAERLLSCSADRTVIIRQRARRELGGVQNTAYFASRVVTLKATPLSMALQSGTGDLVLVSTMDRHVIKLDMSSGTIIDSFKVADPGNEDTVILNAICLSNPACFSDDQTSLLVGFSVTDKSIRLYDAEKGLLLSRESGHTEGVSDIALLEQYGPDNEIMNRTIISTGLDGTILLWRILNTAAAMQSYFPDGLQGSIRAPFESDETPIKASPATLPPLRKVLTKVDIVEFVQAGFPTSPDSPRSLSPPRMKRRTSRLNLSTTIVEANEGELSAPSAIVGARLETERGRPVPLRSPSSPSEPDLKKLQPDSQRNANTTSLTSQRRPSKDRSPSPPPSMIASSMPNTPKHRRQQQQSNHTRLRRPPSMPSDLRNKALSQAPARRQSICAGPTEPPVMTTTEFGSITMATEQACRMLRTYRKKLTATKAEDSIGGLDELENELQNMLRIVRERSGKTRHTASENQAMNTTNGITATQSKDVQTKRKASKGNDNMDDLAVLMDRTNLTDQLPKNIGNEESVPNNETDGVTDGVK